MNLREVRVIFPTAGEAELVQKQIARLFPGSIRSPVQANDAREGYRAYIVIFTNPLTLNEDDAEGKSEK